MQSYDIVGDVHGRASALQMLLTKLGYQRKGAQWYHGEGRRLIFLGDMIDVGPEQLQTLIMVRALMDSGIAQSVMGNHEFNAICYATPDESNPGDYLRSHREPWGKGNRQQHQAFLNAFEFSSPDYLYWIGWMIGLPLWIETDDLRVVHSCWNQQVIDRLSRIISERCIVPSLLASASDATTPLGADVSMLLKGPELPLPADLTFRDRSGHSRDHVRQAWWRTHARTYDEAALAPTGVQFPAWSEPLPSELVSAYTESKPTFFGHYCFMDIPPLVGPRTACLDTCAARGNKLTAYRWEGETVLTNEHLISASASAL